VWLWFCRIFFNETDFPFSLKVSASALADLSRKDDIISEIVTVIGCNYTQAFFKNKTNYPYIGFTGSYDFKHDKYLYGIALGLNFRLN
jgi:hypothetical protein